MMRYGLLILAIFATWGSGAPVAATPRTPDARSATSPTASRSDREPTAPASRTGSDLPLVDNGALQCDSTATNEELLASAREMFVADNYALAEMLYQCVLARDPNELSAILELSIVYETAGKLPYAKGLLSRAAILRPFDQEIIDRNAELSSKLSRVLEADVDSLLAHRAFEAALPKLSALVDERPDDAELYYKKARCCLELGDAAGALVEIEKAVRIGNDVRYLVLRSEASKLHATKDVGALVHEAKSLATSDRKADRERALAVLSEILARDPGHEWAKKQFLVLSHGAEGAAHADARPNVLSRVTAHAKSAAENTAVFVTGIVNRIQRHFWVLVAALVILIVLRSPLTRMIVRGFEPRQLLSGRLNEFNIQEILSLVHSQGKNGVLWVFAGPVKGRVYFVDGEIHHCASGKSKGRDAVRRLLTRARDGHFVLTRLPRSFERTMDIPFSLVLMDIGERSFLELRAPETEATSGPRKKSKIKSLLENKS